MNTDTRFRKFVLVPLLALASAGVVALAAGYLTDASLAAPPKAAAPPPKAQVTFPAISYQLPSDIPGGAGKANITQAATFAWQEFIALNWPASPTGVSGSKTRAAPDTSKKFGADSSGSNQANQPVVWETYRAKVETFPGVGNPPGYSNGPAQDYGFDIAPQYVYGPRSTTNGVQNNPGGNPLVIPSCVTSIQPIPATPYVNLDEVNQIGLDTMFAGTLPSSILNPTPATANAQPQQIRFLAKGNRAYYDYVAANTYWYHGQAFLTAQQNFANASFNNTYPPTAPTIKLPPGTVLVKAAWRALGPTEKAGDFHTKTVRFYDQNPAKPGTACYRQQVWALVALHIIQKTPSAPYFIFATFEYYKNLLTPNGAPVENQNGGQVGTPPATNTQPTYNAFDLQPGSKYFSPAMPLGKVVPVASTPPPPSPPAGSQSPQTVPAGPYCTTGTGNGTAPSTDQRVFYKELSLSNAQPVPPNGQGACVNKRYFAIPTPIQQVNAAAHQALAAYGAPTLWQNYKLVNVQFQPFNVADIDPTGVNTNRLISTFFLSNSVVETDDTLQQFFGGLFAGTTTFAKTNFEQDSNGNLYAQLPAFNIDLPPAPGGTSFVRFNMGGCMGCHGRAQHAGTDFSFTMSNGPVAMPEFAVPNLPGKPMHTFAAGVDKERLQQLLRAFRGGR